MTVLYYTLGCKVNQYDTQTIREMLGTLGYTEFPADSDGSPDIIIVNTCTVTSESDRKARNTVSRCRKKYPDSVILVTGCFPQAYFDEACGSLSADIIIGNACNRQIPELLSRFFAERKQITLTNPHKPHELISSMSAGRFEGHTRAFIKIEDGCNRFCSYCAIPYSRGRVRSKPLEAVKNEISELAGSGYREVVLAGINLTAYGIDRIRLGSMEPDQLSDEIINRIAQCKKLCPQFHLSLQSGCDKTLLRMKRHYDSAFYFNLVSRLREKFPGCAITTDIMVGFPGEDEEEFEQSLAFARKVSFARAHVFSYSRRSGTPAAEMPDQVLNRDKEQRARRMSAECERSEAAFSAGLKGSTVSVLFEREFAPGVFEGYCESYINVRAAHGKNIAGQIMNVKITDSDGDFCTGEIQD